MRLEWIDGVPDHWKVAESQFVLDHQKREVQDDDEIVTAFRDGQVTLRSKRRTDGFTMADKEIGYQHICEGDLVVHSMDGGFGAIGVSDSCGKASPVVHAYTSDSCDLRFISYQLRSAVNAGWIAALAKGIRVRSTQFDRPALAGLKIAYPSLESQQRIADYLDQETAEIDAAVADLDTHVELLKKRRRLVVTKAVAGDVGPGEGFSESWDQVPLRAVSADGGLFVDGDWVETKDQDPSGEIRLTQLADVGESVFLDKSDRWVNESKFEELGCTEVFPGDLLIARMPDPIARCTVMPDGLGYPAITVVDVAILRAGSDWNNRYVMWVINSQSFRNDVDSRVSGSTRQRISRSALGRTKLFRPPLEIQQQIADYLDRETAEIDSLIAESTNLRNLLLKRRSVLITEVVTGRKQV